MSSSPKRPVRIANCSGFFGDRQSALAEVVRGGDIDFVTGDYLAEITMLVLAKLQAKNPQLGFAPTFLQQIEPVLAEILERKIRVVVNAGGLNPKGLALATGMLAAKLGKEPRIAIVLGDDLKAELGALAPHNRGFSNLESGASLPLESDGFVITANAYLGAFGITAALDDGADIVICPRVTDASLVVGAAAHWHGWGREQFDELAGAVAAGHVIECGPQATGGNYSSFHELGPDELMHPAFPIAEVAHDGSSVITKHEGAGGRVTVGTVTAQLVYEIAGPRYLGPDVVSHFEELELEAIGPDRVAMRGAKGSPPPVTTKIAITTRGRFRNEMLFGFVGEHIDAKIAWFEREVRAALEPKGIEARFVRIGSAKLDAASQDEATVLLRVMAECDDEKKVGRPFSSALIELGLSSYPGLFALGLPGPATEATAFWPSLVRQADVPHRVLLASGREVSVPLPPGLVEAPAPLAEIALPPARDWGPTTRAPLGQLVDARSGDKGSHANVGLWVRDDDSFAWLVHALDEDALRRLLPEAVGLRLERHVLPKLRALNFVVYDLLAGGAIAARRLDRQAKALGEYLRSRSFDLPVALLEARASAL